MIFNDFISKFSGILPVFSGINTIWKKITIFHDDFFNWWISTKKTSYLSFLKITDNFRDLNNFETDIIEYNLGKFVAKSENKILHFPPKLIKYGI